MAKKIKLVSVILYLRCIYCFSLYFDKVFIFDGEIVFFHTNNTIDRNMTVSRMMNR